MWPLGDRGPRFKRRLHRLAIKMNPRAGKCFQKEVWGCQRASKSHPPFEKPFPEPAWASMGFPESLKRLPVINKDLMKTDLSVFLDSETDEKVQVGFPGVK